VNPTPRRYVTLEGYAVEGGFDTPGGVMTCYAPTIALGRHPGPGEGARLWRDYEAVLDLVPALGVDGVRLTLEWARLEPRRGEFDDSALARYGDVVRYARAKGLGVTIVLVDTAWPSWLGQEAWLLPWVVPRVLEHARRVVDALASDVGGVVAFSDPEELVVGGFLRGSRPPWRRRATRDANFARAQLAHITDALCDDATVGPTLVVSSVTRTLGVTSRTPSRGPASDVTEIYVRSLVAGHGPTRAPRGLLVREGEQWRVDATVGELGTLV